MKKNLKVGCLVGRFQCHRLTDGHKDLIRHVSSKCDKLLIFIGVYPLPPNFKNPLPYEIRRFMIYEFIPPHVLVSHKVVVEPIVDVFNIPLWSYNLDKRIKELTAADDVVTMYGSRDSFIFNYQGKYKTEEVESKGDSSATQLRNEIKKLDILHANTNEEFRKGVIWILGQLEA